MDVSKEIFANLKAGRPVSLTDGEGGDPHEFTVWSADFGTIANHPNEKVVTAMRITDSAGNYSYDKGEYSGQAVNATRINFVWVKFNEKSGFNEKGEQAFVTSGDYAIRFHPYDPNDTGNPFKIAVPPDTDQLLQLFSVFENTNNITYLVDR